MQRYRVNYGLLIGLLAGLVVIGGVGYVVLKIQLDRNADQLLRRAEETTEIRDKAALLLRYHRQRPNDVDAARDMANTFGDILSEPDVEPRKDYANAVNLMETVVREHGDEVPDLRQRLATLYMLGQRWVDALQHIDILLNTDARNEELQRLRVTCLLRAQKPKKALDYSAKLVGLDLKKGGFAPEAALSPNVVEVYPQLSRLVRQLEKDEELADAVIDRMVDANPESAKALVLRSQYLLAHDREEDADKDLAVALAKEPKDAQVLLSNAIRKRVLEDYDGARGLLDACIQEHPSNANAYRELALLEYEQTQDIQRALAHLDAGLEEAPPGPARSLQFFKASLQADSSDAEGLASTIEELTEMGGLQQHQMDFLRGRLLFINREWFKAAQLLEKIRPIVGSSVEMGGPTNFLLGVCYQQLGQLDKASEAFGLAKELQPNNARIDIALAGIRQRLAPNQRRKGDGLTAQVIAELDKPESEQDWEAIDEDVQAYAERMQLRPVMLPVLRADILMRREKFDEARKLIETAEAEHPDSQALARLDVLLTARDPDLGPVEALKTFHTKVASKFPQSVAMRLLKADLLITIDDEALTEQLMSLSEGIEDWETDKQVQLWKGLGTKFAQIRDNESRRLCLNKVTELAPGELSTLLDLFQAALASGDDATMKETQEKILDVVGDENNPTYLFTRASRLTRQAIAEGNSPELLGRAKDLIDRAIGTRPTWHLLYLARADIEYARGDRAASLEALDKAEELGPMTAAGMVRHIALLTEAARFKDARRVLENTNPAIRQRLLGRQYAEVLLRVGSIDKAIESANQVIESGIDNAGAQLWHSRFMRRVAASPQASESEKQKATETAVSAVERTLELAPESAEAWLDLVTLHVVQKDRLLAEEALRRAQLALPADQVTAVLARGYELIGRFFDAENLYRSLIVRRPNDLGVKRQLASFYLSDRYPRDDSQLKATQLINEMLKAAQDAEDPYEPNLSWARRAAAEQLSRTQDYQNLLNAERLLEANAKDGRLERADQLLMAQILAPRPEPASRLKAIRLLENLKQDQNLPANLGLMLGQLYFQIDDWDACRTQMINVIAQNPELAAARTVYIRMLLRKGDSASLAEASKQLDRLQKIAPTLPSTLELVARVYTEYGQKDKAKRVLAPIIRNKSANGETFLNVARLLSDLGDTESAEQIYRGIAKQSPLAELQYAMFIGKYQDVDKAFDLLDELRSDVDVNRISSIAMSIARQRRDDYGDAIDGKVQSWLDRGLREDPESVDLMMMQAELFDMQKNYPQAEAIYHKLLANSELTKRYRAVVLNNLAYLMALSSTSAKTSEEAMGYVAEAIDIIGPTADILDTRAVVFLAQGKAAEAIADLNLSLTDNPTASKHFHKSQAHFMLEDLKPAIEEWDAAIDLGLTRESVASAEQATFDKLQSQVASIRRSGKNK